MNITNITDILNAKDNDTIDLTANALYTVTAPLVIKANNLKINGNGATIMRTGTGSTTFSVTGHTLNVNNLTFDSDHPLAKSNKKTGYNAIRAYAPGILVNHCIGKNIDDLVFLEATATGSQVTSCVGTNEVRGDLIYIAGTKDVIISYLTATESQNEHIIRVEMSEAVGNIPPANSAGNITITYCNLNNSDGKETIAIRNCGGPISVTGCSLGAWVRAGQVAPAGYPVSTNSVSNFTIAGCHFTNKAFLQLDQGLINTVVHQNIFDIYSAYEAIRICGPNVNVKLQNNIRKILQTPHSNCLYVAAGLSKTDSVVETGTLVQ